MEPHSIEDLVEEFKKLHSTVAIANHILANLIGYRKDNGHRSDDIRQVVNSLFAFASVTEKEQEEQRTKEED